MDKLSLLVSMAQQGLTAAQIKAAMNAAFSQTIAQQTQQAQQVAQEQQVRQAQQIAQEQQAQSDISALAAKMDELIGAVRSGAVIGSSQPKQDTADDVLGLMLANIIPPEGGMNNG